MRKTLLITLLLATVLWGCQKNGTQPSVQLSGKYALYRRVDTSYYGGIRSKGIYEYTVQVITGDTVYVNPGTSSYVIQPNTIGDALRKINLSDTLNFTSITAGVHTSFVTTKTNFTYSVPTGVFNDNSANTRTTIAVVGDQIKLTVLQASSNGTISYATAELYKKL